MKTLEIKRDITRTYQENKQMKQENVAESNETSHFVIHYKTTLHNTRGVLYRNVFQHGFTEP